MKSIRFENDRLYLLDQTRLPLQETWLEFTEYRKIVAAIKARVVTGGSAVGIVGSYTYLLAALACSALPNDLFAGSMVRVKKEIMSACPNSRSLKAALENMERVLAVHDWKPRACEALRTAALELHFADAEKNREISLNGLAAVPKSACILTAASTGDLSTGGFGTALGIVRAAYKAGRVKMVFICETRPDFDGSRIAAYELQQDNIPVTVHTDSSAAVLMSSNLIDLVVLSSDHVASDGDALCAPGSYALAILARYHGVPLYVTALDYAIDLSSESGADLRIDQMSAESLVEVGSERVYSDGVKLFNPSGDIVPHGLMTGIITKKGIVYPPYSENLVNILI
ncbi:MAG: s-methyl-5-thioribose-1-phosphate isomerase [Clostridiales bacterium]|jgi:methylthioribose-1-phosphate isomerase|nr:s-methyl-5-thioribose-1-phosphate isomerase [Clostridiales bacterium]